MHQRHGSYENYLFTAKKVACLFIFRYLRFGFRRGNSYQAIISIVVMQISFERWALNNVRWARSVELIMPFNFKYLRKIYLLFNGYLSGWVSTLVRSIKNIVLHLLSFLFSFYLYFRFFWVFFRSIHNNEWHLNYKCDNCLKMTSQYNKFEWNRTQPNRTKPFRWCGNKI